VAFSGYSSRSAYKRFFIDVARGIVDETFRAEDKYPPLFQVRKHEMVDVNN